MSLTTEQIADLEYLRSLDQIIIPAEFTYWCHNTMYKPLEDQQGSLEQRRCWSSIPTSQFTVKGEMSFLGRVQRINHALDYNDKPATSYANAQNSFPFQIRVLQPKMKYISTVYPDKVKQSKQFYAERGLGDGRHPKLPHKTEVYVIGFSTVDEYSGDKIDIVYGVTADDISIIANKIKSVLSSETVLQPNANIEVVNNRAYEQDVPTVIAKHKNMLRWQDSQVSLTQNGPQTTMLAGYKQEYLRMKK